MKKNRIMRYLAAALTVILITASTVPAYAETADLAYEEADQADQTFDEPDEQILSDNTVPAENQTSEEESVEYAPEADDELQANDDAKEEQIDEASEEDEQDEFMDEDETASDSSDAEECDEADDEFMDVDVAKVHSTNHDNDLCYTDFDEAVSAWKEAGDGSTLTLLADVTTENIIDVESGCAERPMEINLNNHGIIYKGPSTEKGFISVVEGKALKLVDGSDYRTEHYLFYIGSEISVSTEVPGEGKAYVLSKGGYIAGGNSEKGGAVYVHSNGSFTMTGGNICANTSLFGGGVYVDQNASFTMSGGTIAGNSAGFGKAVYGTRRTVTLKGLVSVAESTNGVDAHVVFPREAVLDINKYGFISVGPICSITYRDGNSYDYSDFDEALHDWNQAGNGAKLTLMGDVEVQSTISISGGNADSPLILDFNDHGIIHGDNAQESVIKIEEGKHLEFIDSCREKTVHYIVLDTNSRGKSIASDAPADGDCVEVTGGFITGGHSADNGGGVYISDNSSLKMSSVTICGNYARYGGGGVYNGGTFIMSSGMICSNKTPFAGGGVNISQNADFIMNGGEIRNNKSANGGGVNNIGSFTMIGGKIYGNTASQVGNAVRNQNGTVTLNGIVLASESIDGQDAQTVRSDEAAVRIDSYGYISVSHICSVEANGTTTLYEDFNDGVQAWNDAGAGAKITLLADTATVNTVSVGRGNEGNPMILDLNDHGLIYKGTDDGNVICVTGCLELIDGSSNKTEHYITLDSDGRGVAAGTVIPEGETEFAEVTGGFITGGHGSSFGGGVLNNGTFTMKGGTICGNTSESGGGVGNSGRFTMYGGQIFCNNADGNGNAIHNDQGTLAFKGAIHVSESPEGEDAYRVSEDAAINSIDSIGYIKVSPICSVTVDRWTITDYTDFNEGVQAWKSAGYREEARLTLLADVETEGSVNMNGGSDGHPLILDLNGFGIMYTGSDDNRVINTDGNIEITDSSTDKTERYILLDDNGRGISVSTEIPEEGTDYVEITEGYISGGIISGVYTDGSGVYINSGTLTLSGGTICGNIARNGGGVFNRSGTFTMCGGKICRNRAGSCGGGVYTLSSSCTFNLKGGEISGNTAGNHGGGVYHDHGTFTMTGGKISKNMADDGAGLENGGNATMTGGEISDNICEGGNGLWNDGSFTMNGGKICGNIYKDQPAGLGVINYGSFTMNGGEISHNEGRLLGQGFTNYDATFTMNGGKICDNNGTAVDNIAGKFIMNGGLISDKRGINNTWSEIIFNGAIQMASSSDGEGARYVSPDEAARNCGRNGYIEVTDICTVTSSDGTAKDYRYISDGLSAWYDSGAGAKLTLLGYADISDSIEVNDGTESKPMILELNGRGIKYKGDRGKSVINVGAKKHLCIMDSSADDTVHYVSLDSDGRGTVVTTQNPGGTQYDEVTGSYITGGYSEYGGGLNNAGTVTLDNITISGNVATVSGGGVNNAGTLTSNSGTISGNKTAGSGGGLNNTGTFTLMSGNISRNSATGSGGGANNVGTVTLDNVTISGNVAMESGGGVNNTGALTFNSGTIDGNKAGGSGGGVNNAGTFALKIGNICGNEAYQGGGVFITQSGLFRMICGELINNTAQVCDAAYNDGGNVTLEGYVYVSDESEGRRAHYVETDEAVENINSYSYLTVYMENIASVTANGKTDIYNSFTEAADEWLNAGAGAELTLLSDVVTDAPITVLHGTREKPMKLDLNGHGLLYGGNEENAVITVGSAGSASYFELGDSGVQTIHYIMLGEDGRGISSVTEKPSDFVKHTEITGGYISGGYGSYGGVCVQEDGNFIMTGGTICGNVADDGAVYVSAQGSFVMSGGTICGNRSIHGGGVRNNGTFNMNGGVIDENTATYGGGVYNVGTFTMTGGEIGGNTADESDAVCGFAGTVKFEGQVYVSSKPDGAGARRVSPETAAEKVNTYGYISIFSFWYGTVADMTYTGAAIKPDVKVYMGTKLLKEKTDYSISFSNNTDAGTAKFTITGKGNYKDKETGEFKILKKNLADPDVTVASIASTAYNKNKAYKPVPSITYNKKKLAVNKDFSVKYYKDRNCSDADEVPEPKEARKYWAKVTGIDNKNYTGSITVPFFIALSDQIQVSKLTVARIPDQAYYYGYPIEPAITVKNGTKPVNPDCYTVEYFNNTSIGTASAVITGVEGKKYVGSKTVTFKIVGKALSKAFVVDNDLAVSVEYSGKSQQKKITLLDEKNNPETALAGVDKATYDRLPDGSRAKLAFDYIISYEKNVDAGTATMLLTGVNGRTGTVKKTFKINKFNIKTNTDGKFRIELDEQKYQYAKAGCKPKPRVTFNGRILKEGTDYTLSYSDNMALGAGTEKSKPTVKVTGKGNFTGTEEKHFKIVKADLETGGIKVEAKDVVLKKDKPGNWKTGAVSVSDRDGRKLTVNKDYTIEFTSDKNGDKPMLDNQTVGPDTTVYVQVKAADNSPYKKKTCGSYRVSNNDIGKLTASIVPKAYTGKPVMLNPEDITWKSGGKSVTLQDGDFVIDPSTYEKNVEKGTATVIVIGKGEYCGSKKLTFTIGQKGILWWWNNQKN